MGMTIERGATAAVELAKRNLNKYNEAVRLYGNVIDLYRGEAPRPLLISHILRVNTNLFTSPKFKDYRQGFMGVNPLQANLAEVEMSKISGDPAVCAYVYSRDLNRVSYDIYTTYPSLFTETGEDFWRCAYLRTTLGDEAFSTVWDMHPPTSADESIYEVLLYSVNNLSRALMGQPVPMVKELVLKDCEFVFQLALLKGALITEGAGIEPVPLSRNAADIFTRVRNGSR